MNWQVYIVECADGSLYTGISNNVEKRVRDHNTPNRGAKYTRSRQPVTLRWTSKDFTLSEAATLEYKIKSMTREQKEIMLGGKKKP